MSSNGINIPTEAAIVLLGNDATECLRIETKLRSLGMTAVKKIERGNAVLTLLEARHVDLLYLVGSPADMDVLTFIRAARSAKIPAGVAMYFVVRANAKLLESEREFLKAYSVTILKLGADDEKSLSGSVRRTFQDLQDKSSVTSRLEDAKRLMRDGLTGWAAKVYKEILADEDHNVTARVGLMRASVANPEVYWTQLQTLLKQDPHNYYFKFEQIDRLILEGRGKEVQALLDEVTALLKDDSELFWLIELGVICVGEKILPFCFKIVEMIRRKARQDQLWQGDLLESRTHLVSGNVDEATRLLSSAIRQAPGPRVEIENLKAILARKRGAFDEAAIHYQAALHLSPEDHRVAFNIGLCREHMGELKEALAAYKKAIGMAPSYARALAKISELEARIRGTSTA